LDPSSLRLNTHQNQKYIQANAGTTPKLLNNYNSYLASEKSERCANKNSTFFTGWFYPSQDRQNQLEELTNKQNLTRLFEKKEIHAPLLNKKRNIKEKKRRRKQKKKQILVSEK
jgi:hypothetical protein